MDHTIILTRNQQYTS